MSKAFRMAMYKDGRSWGLKWAADNAGTEAMKRARAFAADDEFEAWLAREPLDYRTHWRVLAEILSGVDVEAPEFDDEQIRLRREVFAYNATGDEPCVDAIRGFFDGLTFQSRLQAMAERGG